MSRTTVAKHLAERGIETPKGIQPVDVGQAMALYTEELSSTVIGKRLGFDNHTIISVLRAKECQFTALEN